MTYAKHFTIRWNNRIEHFNKAIKYNVSAESLMDYAKHPTIRWNNRIEQFNKEIKLWLFKFNIIKYFLFDINTNLFIQFNL